MSSWPRAAKCSLAPRTSLAAPPNTLVDERILGLPGTLPVMNRTAVEYSIQVGLALGCKIAKHTKWDRKSYYYPDLPKNYQISQYDLPLCHDGVYELTTEDGCESENSHSQGPSGGGRRQAPARGAGRLSNRLEYRRSQSGRHPPARDRDGA